MANIDLVNGNKELLLAEFRRLYPLHKTKWRSLLKKHNEWHGTDTGLRAWQNIGKGTTGNESLRKIIADMQEIVLSVSKKSILQKQGLSSRSVKS